MTPSTHRWLVPALVIGSLSLGCEDRDRDKTQPRAEQQGQVQEEKGPTVEQIEEEPYEFIGKKVTLTGEVDDVHSERSFVLGGNEWLFEHEILVLTKSPVQLTAGTFVENDEVVVTGTVKMLSVAEMERELGWDLEERIETKWTNKPVIVAESIREIEDAGVWNEQQQRPS